MSKWKWKERGCGVRADVAGHELERIEQRDGKIRPETVVEEAKPEAAPLHRAFEWDDAKAAHRYRVQVASTLIRAVVKVDPQEEKPRQAFVLAKASDEIKPGYRSLDVVVHDTELFADALRRLQVELLAASRSVRALEEIAGRESAEPERLARIGMAVKALEAASVAIQALH